MKSEIYLSQKEHDNLEKWMVNNLPSSSGIHYELGVLYVYTRGQYKIINKKKWFLAKIKYGI
jgi:hypothetical protein